MTEVSIIIPTYRRPHYLLTAIESVVRQSLTPSEIIVIDDGGTLPGDFSPGPMPPGIDLQIRPIAHAGQCSARRAGFDLSRGEFVLFLDDDDTLHPDAVATLLAMHQGDSGLVATVGAAESVDATGAPRGRVNQPPNEIDSTKLRTGNQIATAGCVLVRRSAYVTVGGWDVQANNAADYLLWMRLASVGRIAGTEKIVLHYRSHSTNESAKGHQFLELRQFRKAYRCAFPDLAGSDVEEDVITSLIAPYLHPAIRHWRSLVRQGEWGAALRHGARIISGMSVSVTRRKSRRAMLEALSLWRPKWLRRPMSES